MKIRINTSKKKLAIYVSVISIGLILGGNYIHKKSQVKALIHQASIQIEQEDPTSALQTLREAIIMDRKNLDLYEMVEQIYYEQQNYAKLIEFYNNNLNRSKKVSKFMGERLEQIASNVKVIDATSFVGLNETDIELPRNILLELEGTIFELPVTSYEGDIDTSTLGTFMVNGNVEQLNLRFTHEIEVGFKAGNDMLFLKKFNNGVYDQKEWIYYPDKNALKAFNVETSEIKILNYPIYSSEIMSEIIRNINLYQNHLFFLNNTTEEIVKYNLLDDSYQIIVPSGAAQDILRFRTVNNKGYMLSLTSDTGKDFSLYIVDLNTNKLEKKLDLTTYSYDLYIDDDGSVVGMDENKNLVRYDAQNDYQLEQSNIIIENILAIDREFIYYKFKDLNDTYESETLGGIPVTFSKSKIAKVQKIDFGQQQLIYTYEPGIDSFMLPSFFTLHGELYELQPPIKGLIDKDACIVSYNDNQIIDVVGALDHSFSPVIVEDSLMYLTGNGEFKFYK